MNTEINLPVMRRAGGLLDNIREGHVRAVSIGYQVHAYERSERGGGIRGRQLRRRNRKRID
ncbi:MAG: hypothetical protein U9N14_07555, partial [Pseudomonadota bacterium]|nr:hypothetical protein [Pseudomonadota bacterium]